MDASRDTGTEDSALGDAGGDAGGDAALDAGGDRVRITYEVAGRLSSHTDGDCDGTPETCDVVFYDPDGRRVATGLDADCDGKPKGCVVQVLDDAGQTTLSGLDKNCDGVLDASCEHSPGNAGGYPVGNDRDCDGVPESHCVATTYDDAGRATMTGSDEDCDGKPESDCLETPRDGAGRIAKRIVDGNCDGKPSNCTAYRYDTQGHLVEERRDYHLEGGAGSWHKGCDGIDDRCYLWTYDIAGRQSSFAHDDDCDGKADSHAFTGAEPCDGTRDDCRRSPFFDGCITRATNSKGAVIRVDYDADCNGTPETCSFATRDAAAQTTTWDHYQDCDAKTVLLATSTYAATGLLIADQGDDCLELAFDDAGRIVSKHWNVDCDGPTAWSGPDDVGWGDPPYKLSPEYADDCRSWKYDSAGRLIADRYDYACDDMLAECRKYKYDALGRLVGRADTYPCGTSPVFETYVYDDAGHLSAIKDEGCTTYEYEGLPSVRPTLEPSAPIADPNEIKYVW
jgi:hypothetical protein